MPKFLDKITINHKLVRTRKVEYIDGIRQKCKNWEKKQIKPTDVYVLGERTLSNGIVWNMIDYIEYRPLGYINALLVIKDKHTNPFYILSELEE